MAGTCARLANIGERVSNNQRESVPFFRTCSVLLKYIVNHLCAMRVNNMLENRKYTSTQKIAMAQFAGTWKTVREMG